MSLAPYTGTKYVSKISTILCRNFGAYLFIVKKGNNLFIVHITLLQIKVDNVRPVRPSNGCSNNMWCSSSKVNHKLHDRNVQKKDLESPRPTKNSSASKTGNPSMAQQAAETAQLIQTIIKQFEVLIPQRSTGVCSQFLQGYLHYTVLHLFEALVCFFFLYTC